MKDLLVLRDLECVKAIAHPRRIDILNAFDKEPLSAKQLSEMLDEPHAKINYHIKTLYNVGILQLVEEKIKSGIVEKYYYPTANNIVNKSEKTVHILFGFFLTFFLSKKNPKMRFTKTRIKVNIPKYFIGSILIYKTTPKSPKEDKNKSI